MARRSILNRSFSTRETVLILILAVLVIVACYYFLVIKNVADTVAANNQQLAQIEASTDVQESLAVARTRMQEELAALGDNENLPEVAVYDNIRSELDELNALLQSATTYNLSFGQPTLEGQLVRRPVTVSFTVPDYASALTVVRELENGKYRCQINDISLTGDLLANGSVSSVSATLSVAYLETINGATNTSGLVEKDNK